jgi:DNA-binding CsgD family transcriptional regulator
MASDGQQTGVLRLREADGGPPCAPATTESDLLRRAALAELAIDTVNAPIVVLDMLGRMQGANPAASRLLGCPSSQLMGRSFWQPVPSAEIVELRAVLDSIYADGSARITSAHWLGGVGARPRRIVWTLSPLLGPDDSVAYIVAAGDLTDDAAREAEDRAAADCLGHVLALVEALEGADTVEQVAAVVLARARSALEASAGVLMRCSADGRSLEMLGAVGYPADAVDLRVALDMPVPLATAVHSGEPVLLGSRDESMLAGYARRPDHLELGYGAWAAVPLKRFGQVVGALEVSFMGAHVFGQEDRGFLALLAVHSAEALGRIEACAGAEIRGARAVAETLPSIETNADVMGASVSVSPRERQVLALLARGLSQPEIAARLSVGIPTIKTHIEHLCQKFGVSGSARTCRLAAQAALLGLLPAEMEAHGIIQLVDTPPETGFANPLIGGWSAGPVPVTLDPEPGN